jgi:hypothetical protein
MNYPVLIVRNDDGEKFIHMGNGQYRTLWGVMNGSISLTPFEAFNPTNFTFYYENT